MKQLIFIILLGLAGSLNAQTWKTMRLNTSEGFGIGPPYDCFKLNPYTNDLWFCSSPTVACISTDGNVHFMDMANVSGPSNHRDMAFTPSNAYFVDQPFGLYRINSDYSKSLVYNENNAGNIFSNGDTVYMTLPSPDGYLSYTNNGSILSTLSFERIHAKNNIKYPAFSQLSSFAKYTGFTSDGYEAYSAIDNEYICGQYHDAKFSRLTDTFYVSCTAGITKAINYDFNDSIVPSNTIDMPAANVIEFEFDDLDRLWAVFGDADDVAFAIARLDGNAWTNRYDASNCPIDFAEFKGMEIDTLGNLWISERFYLHTLLTPNSPAWLGTKELTQQTLSAYPNPAKDKITIDLPTAGGKLNITTLSGTILLESDQITDKQLSLDVSAWFGGCYIISWSDGTTNLQTLMVK